MKKICISLFRLSLLFFCLTLFHVPVQARSTFQANTILAPGDTIAITVKNHPLLNHIAGTYTINPRNTVTIPGVGEIQASGKSLASLQDNLRKMLLRVTSTSSNAEISLLEQNRFLLMANGVRYPGWYKVPLRPSIDELVETASGLQPGADTQGAIIIRKSPEKTKEIPFAKALPLQSFDKLSLNVETDSAIVDNGDLLYVIIPREVTGEFSPTERNYFKEKVEIDRHGFIFLPSQGNIKISGYTTAQISEMLTRNLPKYLSKSDKASVNLIEKRHYIQILGHVTTPGWYNIPESSNIQAILSQAGGTLEGADLENVTISRTIKGNSQSLLADIQYYLSTGDNKMLPVLHENDIVFVPLAPVTENTAEEEGAQPDSDSPRIRIFGAVNSPGIYPAPKGMTLLDLLITAQGEAQDADLTQIKIMRANGKREMFNMQALLDAGDSEQKNSFPLIYGGDIVHIARQTLETGPVNPQTGLALPQTITLAGPGSATPGLRPFTAKMTPLEAIAQGGGVSDFADTNDIIIIRRVEGKQKNIKYNYDKALKGEAPDVDFELMANDIIYIP